MRNCTYKIKLGNEIFEFNSDEELNSFLNNNYHRIKAMKIVDPEFLRFSKDFSQKEENIAKVQKAHASSIEMSTVYTPDGEKDIRVGAGYIGVTKKIDQVTLNDRRIVKEFNVENYITNNLPNEIAKIRQNPSYANLSDSELEKSAREALIRQTQDWKTLGKMGTNIHQIAELFFNEGEKDPNTLLTKVTDPLSLDTMTKYVESLQKLKEQIQFDTNDPDVKIFSEVRIHDPNSNVAGIIDILAIDKDGNAHIYDLKTSYKPLHSWNTAKTTKLNYQIAFYEQLVNSIGIPVKGMNVVPFELKGIDYDNNVVSDLEMGKIEDLNFVYSQYPIYRMVAKSEIPVSINSLMDINIESTNIKNELKNAYGYEVKTGYTNSKETFIQQKVKEDDHAKKFFIDTFAGNTRVYLTGDQLTDDALIDAYLKKQAENSNFMVTTLKNVIDKTIRDDGNDLIKFLPTKLTRDNQQSKLVDKIFSRYTDGTWEVLESATLDSLGIIALLNKPTGTLEFVSVTTNDTTSVIPLSKGKSILGNFVSDSVTMRDNKILASTAGNLEAIKIAMFLNENAETLANTIPNLSIGEIRVVNINYKQVQGINFDDLIHTYNKLTKYTNVENKLGKLKTANQYDLFVSKLNKLMSDDNTPNGFKTKLDSLHKELGNGDFVVNADNIRDLYVQFIKDNKIEDMKTASNDIEDLYQYFSLAVTYLNNLTPRYEEDIRRVALNNSSQFSSPATIGSENIKAEVKLISDAMYNIGVLHTNYKQTTRDVVKKLYDDTGVSIVQRFTIGNNIKAFDRMFVRNSDGSIAENMRLKNPDDMSNGLTKGEREFMRMFLTNINNVRYHNVSEEQIEEAKINGSWYEIPLLKANAVSRFHNKDIRTIWRDYYDDVLNAYNLFKDDETTMKAKANEMLEMFVGFSESVESRNKQLAEHNTSEFETNLELVMDTYMFAHLRKAEFDKVLPVARALRVSTIVKNLGFADSKITNTADFMKDYLKVAVYNDKLIEPHLEKTAKVLGVVRKIVTNANMSLNPISGFRNFLQGQWANVSRIMSKSYGDDMFSFNDYRKAITILIGEGREYVNNVTIVEELNHMYRMANMDINLIAERMNSAQTGLFSGKLGMWMNTAPDYFNRMLLFTAQMIKDGCFDAHEMVNGTMKYNFKKDKRFEVYRSGNKSNPEYALQRGLYLTMLNRFNQSRLFDLKDGDDLPLAYTDEQKMSLKTFADSVHGDYDHETKMLSTQTFFGMMFWQFKNWLGAKKDQWTLKGGIYHQGSYTHVKDDDGNLLYVTVNEDGSKTIGTDVTETALYDWEGRWQEGILTSLGHMWNEIEWSKMNFRRAIDLWKDNGRVRSNLKMMAHDLGVFALLAFIFGLIDWDQLNKDEPIAASTYRAFLGSANDLYIGNNIGALLNPQGSMIPAAGYVFQVKNDFWNVITGDMKFSKAVARNIGTLRPLQYTINNSEE